MSGNPHEVTVIVNGRPKQIAKEVLTFLEVVRLAYENATPTETLVYTVTYKRGNPGKPEGSLVDGETLKVKEGMVINVTETDKS
jgi:hypothetical protein